MSCSSHIFVFWFFVNSYQKTKISAIKFVYFFFLWKPVITEEFFVDWPIRNLFLQQKVNRTKLTANILVFWQLSTKKQRTKIWDEPDVCKECCNIRVSDSKLERINKLSFAKKNRWFFNTDIRETIWWIPY